MFSALSFWASKSFPPQTRPRFARVPALGRKVSDEFTVPLCRTHHRELHRSGSEFRWWETTGIDPLKIARKLWKNTRLNGLPGPTIAARRLHRYGNRRTR